MASVKLTPDIKREIIRKAEAIYGKRISEALAARSPTFAERCVFAIWTPALLAKFHDIPKGYISWSTNVEVHIEHKSYWNNNVLRGHRNPDEPFTVESTSVSYSSANREFPSYCTYSNRWIPVVNFREHHDLCTEYTHWLKELEPLKAEQYHFSNKVADIVQDCTTLKMFLDAFPAGKQFVSNSLIEKHNYKPPPRTRTAPQVIEVDESILAELNEQVVMSTLENLA